MSLAHRLAELVQACFTGLWIQSHEHEDALAEIAQLCQREAWRLGVWDVERGLAVAGASSESAASPAHDPLTAIRTLSSLAAPDGSALLVLVNFHRFLQSAEVVQAMARQIALGKHQRTFLVVLAPLVQLPPELEKLFVVISHDLPPREQLAEIARGIATEASELPAGEAFEGVLDAAAGLTRYEAEGAFSLSLVRHGMLQPETIWELKTQTLVKSGLLSLYRGDERFEQLGGLDALKAFCLRALRARTLRKGAPLARGVLLLGVPGTGKSAFCKALGNETGRPTLILDVGNLLGSLVGQTEERTRQALGIVDAMAPCVLMIDEIEKAFCGATSSGPSDSGVAARMFGAVLSWLNDHSSSVFVVCTANDVSRLPPEFSRAERFDGIFFLDLPSREQKDQIWQIYAQAYGLETPQRRPPDDAWTGAEIKSCCRLAALLDVPL
ncbi:MAG TPA: AAA family ATPase, partial [Pirellulaceae bacterium]|nr:AAA family ATPase [Pirellulaceae bacterium]